MIPTSQHSGQALAKHGEINQLFGRWSEELSGIADIWTIIVLNQLSWSIKYNVDVKVGKKIASDILQFECRILPTFGAQPMPFISVQYWLQGIKSTCTVYIQ